ncbi:unnamed protein product [Microthlaspi erraticum]|uniref:Uncharacterized protein n=1 Tax=Microthlaspi erraticum TaxID=1685480 RepID=A0A6D2KE45_9BRAS|nr:unnamed protein product [Microthlaspi erraticum]
MKRSYNQKSEDCPDGSIENQRPNRAVRLAEKRCFALGQITSVRLKSRPKFNRPADHASRPGKHCPAVGQATTAHATAHDHAARAGKQSLAAAQPVRTTADAPSEPGNYVPRPAEKHHSGRPRIRPATTVPTRAHDPIIRPIVPTDRPNAAVDPKPVLKPVSYFQGPA